MIGLKALVCVFLLELFKRIYLMQKNHKKSANKNTRINCLKVNLGEDREMMQLNRTALEILFYVIIPAGLTWIACLWLFYLYFKTKERTLGFLMIFVLGIADFLFSTAVIGEKLAQDPMVFKFFAYLFYGALYFSILWASAMSYVVFKSLSNQGSNPENLFKKILGAVLIATTVAGIL